MAAISEIVLSTVSKAINVIGRIVIMCVVLIALITLLLDFLPDDPLQPYIAEFSATLSQYTGLIDYFCPVGYMSFAFAFFIAFKYLIWPLRMLFKNAFGVNLELNGQNESGNSLSD